MVESIEKEDQRLLGRNALEHLVKGRDQRVEFAGNFIVGFRLGVGVGGRSGRIRGAEALHQVVKHGHDP